MFSDVRRNVGMVLALLLVVTIIYCFVSPAPRSLLIRLLFDKDARMKREAMAEAIPEVHVKIYTDLVYGDMDDANLDIYVPNNTQEKLPVIIWMHGGAWISGDKMDASPYFQLLADRGFVVVSINYSLGPKNLYPTQLQQLNIAHQYILDHADDFQMDTNSIFLAGDSAGAHLSSQMAAIITNPSYQSTFTFEPSLSAGDIKGMILYCGVYDMRILGSGEGIDSGIIAWGFKAATWAYFGEKYDQNPEVYEQASSIRYITPNFPDTFISGGHGDGLTNMQSKPMAEALSDMGVSVTTLFYEDDHLPLHDHENQFILDADGFENFETMVSYIHQKLNE